jgi:nucleoside-diphosphate-sugar epimerase
MMEDAITGRPHRSLYGSPTDCGVFLYIEDAARAAIELMAAPADQIKMRVYNVTGMNQMVRTKDLGDYLQQRFDGFSVEYAEQKSIKPNTPLIDDRFARDEWGWRPQFNSLELIVDRFKLDFVQPN